MEDIYDIAHRLFAARLAIFGHGELSIRPAYKSERAMWCLLPGTRVPVGVKDVRKQGLYGSLPSLRSGMPRIFLLGSDLDASAFMRGCDLHMMCGGLGASYFPVAGLELADALVFDERWTDFTSILPAVGGGDRVVLSGPCREWRPSYGLARLSRSQAVLSASTCKILERVMRFANGDESEAFDKVGRRRYWPLRMLRERSRTGRIIAALAGEWRELLSVGGLHLACRHLSTYATDPKAVEFASRKYLGVFAQEQKRGGTDTYVLWNDENLPCAVAVIGSDGSHRIVARPEGAGNDGNSEAVGRLLETAYAAASGPVRS